MFGGWQTRVIHERAGLRREIKKANSHRVGSNAARKIAEELAKSYGDGIYRFIRYRGEFNRSKSRFGRPVCEEVFRFKVQGGLVAGNPRPGGSRPCEEFFGY